MSEPIRIEPDNPEYRRFWQAWKADGNPALLNYNGKRWLVLQDNDKMVFVETGPEPGINTSYSSFGKMNS